MKLINWFKCWREGHNWLTAVPEFMYRGKSLGPLGFKARICTRCGKQEVE